uniref:Uncharacterized protein n=1 Tax=Anguilla anguilla TaxID=7936 RepID=A0A0E9UI42_ANGAN
MFRTLLGTTQTHLYEWQCDSTENSFTGLQLISCLLAHNFLSTS